LNCRALDPVLCGRNEAHVCCFFQFVPFFKDETGAPVFVDRRASG